MSFKPTAAERKYILRNIVAADLFCGIGGLTRGLRNKSIHVSIGVDNDASCKYPYEKNNGAKFISSDIASITGDDLLSFYGNAKIRLLVGCAPCQPYSPLNKAGPTEEKTQPLGHFARLIDEVRPEIVSMENVPQLEKHPMFGKFLRVLDRLGYHYSYQTVECWKYGVPQSRQRLVLLASLLGPIELIPPTHQAPVTVRQTIGHLKPIKDGEISGWHSLHRSRRLEEINKKRIRATPKNGGSARSWPEELLPECYRRASGDTYIGTVYGRMRWDTMAPTMTTHCIGLGNGRFGHPQQHRAISLLEAALFQSFSEDYEMYDPSFPIKVGEVARHIGNAVPVLLGEAIAESIICHLAQFVRDRTLDKVLKNVHREHRSLRKYTKEEDKESLLAAV